MKALSTIAFTLLLCSCGTQIYLEHIEPAAVNLARGTSLSISSENAKLADTVIEHLEKERFYHLTPGGKAHLHLAKLKNRYYTGPVYHTCSQDEVCTCTSEDYEEIEATAYLTHPGISPYVQEFGGTGDTFSDACDNLAQQLTQALVPHTETRSFRIIPAGENENLHAAAKACAAGNWELGKNLTTHALKRYPADPEGHFLMGLIERRQGNWHTAAEHMRQALSLREAPDYKEALAETLRLATDSKRARQQLSGAMPPPTDYAQPTEEDISTWQFMMAPFLLGLPLLWD